MQPIREDVSRHIKYIIIEVLLHRVALKRHYRTESDVALASCLRTAPIHAAPETLLPAKTLGVDDQI